MNRLLKICVYCLGFLFSSALMNLGIYYYMRQSLTGPSSQESVSTLSYVTSDQTEPLKLQGYNLLLPFTVRSDPIILSFDKENKYYRIFLDLKKSAVTVEENYNRILFENTEQLAPLMAKVTQIVTTSKLRTNYISVDDMSTEITLGSVKMLFMFTDMEFRLENNGFNFQGGKGYLLIK